MSSAIHEARALLVQFERSPLRDLYWRGPGWAVFMAREGGGANPMLVAAAPEPARPLSGPGQVPVAVPIRVTAPHLGVFEPRCAVGEEVAGSALIGVIDVLGRQTEVFSAQPGRVTAICAPAGNLVEFGHPLVEIAVAA